MIIPSKIYRKDLSFDTFAWAKEFIHEAPDGAVFLADRLGRARGRQSRIWQFYEGQLAVTLLLKPQIKALIKDDDLSLRFNYLTMALSLGILAPIKRFNIALKWPNDFIFSGKKVGGMLTEFVWKGDQPYAVIVGFALNINNTFNCNDPLGGIATSVREMTGCDHDLHVLLNQLFASLDEWYTAWSWQDFSKIYCAWKMHQFYLNKKISVHDIHAEEKTGQVVDFLPNGDLVLAQDSGMLIALPFFNVVSIDIQ